MQNVHKIDAIKFSMCETAMPINRSWIQRRAKESSEMIRLYLVIDNNNNVPVLVTESVFFL